MRGPTELLAFDMVLKKTELAALLDLGDGEQVWIPYSQAEDLEHDFDIGDGPDEVEATEWILKEKGLI